MEAHHQLADRIPGEEQIQAVAAHWHNPVHQKLADHHIQLAMAEVELGDLVAESPEKEGHGRRQQGQEELRGEVSFEEGVHSDIPFPLGAYPSEARRDLRPDPGFESQFRVRC